MMRFITHDWSTRYATQILQSVRSSARPDAKLLIIEAIVPYTCKAAITDEIPGAAVPEPPAPLLPSFGSDMAFQVDMSVGQSARISILILNAPSDVRLSQRTGSYSGRNGGIDGWQWMED